MRARKTLRATPLLLLAALPSLVAVPARAELVIFPEGSFLKVTAYEIDGDRVQVTLPNGGRLTLSLLRVERIIEDEIEEEEETPPPVVPPPPPRRFNLRFQPSHEVPAAPYGKLIYEAAKRHALNPALVAAVVRAESGFDPHAVSGKGARGLMQLMPATAKRFGLEGLRIFEPAPNLDAGARYLSWLIDRFGGRLKLVLAAYNAGEDTVRRYGGIPPFRETRDFLNRVYGTLGLTADGFVSREGAASAASRGR